MEITVLTENTTLCDDIETEHGLSLYISTENKNILFDMGQTDMFYRNAQILGKDLEKIDFAVISHGHYDHGGGLAKFLEINKKAPVYINRNAFMPHYNGNTKYIGLCKELQNSERIIFTDLEFSICNGIKIYPAASDITKKFTSAGLTYIENEEQRAEDFRHEQYLEICENGKRIFFSGCSHRGITNIVKQYTPDVLVGGFHFSKFSIDTELLKYAEFLDSFETQYYTCHCTGAEQFEFLKDKMRNLKYLHCGDSLILQ